MPQRHVVLVVWLLAWAFFGLPWNGLSDTPHPHRIRWTVSPSRRVIADAVLNVAFYVPFGMIASRGRRSWPLVLGTAAGLSLATETAQLYSTTRIPALSDLVLNTLGAGLGIASTSLAPGRRAEPSAD